ncbi:MAG: LemA family protein [Pirellulaceae bacterium]
MSGALGRLFALTESDTPSSANQNMLQLSEEITSTENKVSFFSRPDDFALSYNTYRQSFPAVIFAGMFGHSTMPNCCQFDSAAIADAPKNSFFIKSSTAVSAGTSLHHSLNSVLWFPCYNGEGPPCCVEKYGGGPPCCIKATVGCTVLLYLSLSPMSTNFFERQASAKKSTVWLLTMFALYTVAIVVTVTVVVASHGCKPTPTTIRASGIRQ